MDVLVVLGILAVVAVAVFWIRDKHKAPTHTSDQGIDYANLGQNHGPDDGPKGPPGK